MLKMLSESRQIYRWRGLRGGRGRGKGMTEWQNGRGNGWEDRRMEEWKKHNQG